MKRYGAEEGDWQRLVELGLTSYLLPVVSRPNPKMLPTSAIKDPSKVPSQYNNMNQAHGIKAWQDKQSTIEEVANWSGNPDYGICIRTDHIRAIDVDVDDVEKANAILEFIDSFILLPRRGRANSGKFLLAMRVKSDEIRKSRVPVDGGMIEFLGKGNQFIAYGTHTSGTKYEWDYRGLVDFPEVSEEEYRSIIEVICKTFGTGEVATANNRDRRRGKNEDIMDELLNKLDVLGYGPGGQAYIECPWREEHSFNKDITETTYFPRGTGGYALGHFKCLHAHCETRTDDEFIEALNLRDGSDFDMLPALIDESGLPRILFNTDKLGRKEATLTNVIKALERADYCENEIGTDSFRDEVMHHPYAVINSWQSMSDVFQVDMRVFLERCGFKPVSREVMRDAILSVAERKRFDSAQVWLESLPAWDGVARVDGFLEKYFGAASGEYGVAVSRYIWSALAGRILQPGVKADMIPVLQGPEGIRKSTAIEAIAPAQDFFSEISFDEKEDDLARKMRGTLVCEIAEMRGLHSRELISILAFVSRRFEKWTPKFKEYKVSFPRRCLFFGTTNQPDFLPDDGEHRRFLPFTCKFADPEAIIRDRELLWAEGRELFKANGVMWQDAEKLAKLEHKQFEAIDGWQEEVQTFLDDDVNVTGERNGDFPFTVGDVFKHMGMGAKDNTKAAQMRMAKTLKKMGFERQVKRSGENSKPTRLWARKL